MLTNMLYPHIIKSYIPCQGLRVHDDRSTRREDLAGKFNGVKDEVALHRLVNEEVNFGVSRRYGANVVELVFRIPTFHQPCNVTRRVVVANVFVKICRLRREID